MGGGGHSLASLSQINSERRERVFVRLRSAAGACKPSGSNPIRACVTCVRALTQGAARLYPDKHGAMFLSSRRRNDVYFYRRLPLGTCCTSLSYFAFPVCT